MPLFAVKAMLLSADDAGDNFRAGDDTSAGRGATLLLDYNLVEGTGAALPRYTMRREIQCGRRRPGSGVALGGDEALSKHSR